MGFTLTLPRSFIGGDDENEKTKHRRAKQTNKENENTK